MKQNATLNEAQLSILRLLGSLKTVEEVDKLWESGQWDDEKNESVLGEHLRTPYKYAK